MLLFGYLFVCRGTWLGYLPWRVIPPSLSYEFGLVSWKTRKNGGLRVSWGYSCGDSVNQAVMTGVHCFEAAYLINQQTEKHSFRFREEGLEDWEGGF